MRRVAQASRRWDERAVLRSLGNAAYFDKFGFTVIENALTADDLDAVRAEIERITAERHALADVRIIGTRNPLLPSCDYEDSLNDGGHREIRKITGLAALSATLARVLVRAPVVLDVLHDILGNRIELYRDALMLKSARVGSEKPWHQDAVYWPFRPMQLVSALVAIDEATAANGCLQVIPGTHQQIYQHEKVDGELQLDVKGLAKQAMYVELDPGDCIVFHSLLLHASEHNRSEQRRCVSICSYSPGGLTVLDEQLEPPVLISQRGAK